MTLWRRVLRLDHQDPEAVRATEEALQEARHELRQQVQKVESGARSLNVMRTWESAAELLTAKDRP